MTMELLARGPKVQDLNLPPAFAVTHHLLLTISTLKPAKARMQASKFKNLNQQLVKLQDSNGPVPIAHHRHPRTQPAASVSSSLLLNNQAVRRLPRQVDRLPVKARPQPALELHQSVLDPAVLKHQTQP